MSEIIDFTDLDQFAARGLPHDLFAKLRAQAPVYWQQVSDDDGFWLVTRHEDVVNIARDYKTFSSSIDLGGVMGLTRPERQRRDEFASTTSFLLLDPPEHGKLRGVVTKAILPSAVASVGDCVRRVSIDLIENALNKDVCDFVEDVAVYVPIEALSELGNVPIPDRDQMIRWVNALASPDDPEYAKDLSELVKARRELRSYCEDLYQQRRAAPGSDILSMMVHGEIDGRPVSPQEAGGFFELLLTAGSETTRTVMSHSVLALARHDDQYQIMRNEPEILKKTAVEELLRWACPVIHFCRRVTQDKEIGGKLIRKGDTVAICFASANRDESVFENPFEFDVRRSPNRHLSFGGGGPHSCLGANVARLELRIFFEEFCKRVKRVELLGEPSYLRSNLINGIKHLPVRLHAA